MALVAWTDEEHAALVSGYQRKVAIEFARQCHERVDKLQRDILAVANYCRAELAAGTPASVPAVYAKRAATGYMTADLAPFDTPEKLAIVYATGGQVYGYTVAEVDASLKAIRAAVDRFASTSEDGSTIAADVADVLDQFVTPPTIWS